MTPDTDPWHEPIDDGWLSDENLEPPIAWGVECAAAVVGTICIGLVYWLL